MSGAEKDNADSAKGAETRAEDDVGADADKKKKVKGMSTKTGTKTASAKKTSTRAVKDKDKENALSVTGAPVVSQPAIAIRVSRQ